jgi:GSH-dependent disulfide-bond oxidoreductase
MCDDEPDPAYRRLLCRDPEWPQGDHQLEELGVPYALHFIRIGRGDQFKPAFLEISPNNKIPAIVDPEGPGGKPISIFESGAILKYLGVKFGRFYPADLREQVKVDEWLFWQVGGLGPMLGQYNHFHNYAPEKLPYAMKRYADEAHRLFRVLDTQLRGKDYITGDYSISDMASIGWANGYLRHGIQPGEFPAFEAWHERMNERPSVKRALAIVVPPEKETDTRTDKEAQKVLFNQR